MPVDRVPLGPSQNNAAGNNQAGQNNTPGNNDPGQNNDGAQNNAPGSNDSGQNNTHGEDPPWRDASRRTWHVADSVQGRPIFAELYGTQGPVLLLVSAIHGDERSAVTLGEQIRTDLLSGLAAKQGVQIVFVNNANPDGTALDTRRNVRDIDLNRNFDAQNFGQGSSAGGREPLSEPESQVLGKIIDFTAPSAVVSVHCCAPTMDYDGPASGLALGMAQRANDVLDAVAGGDTYRDFPDERLGSSPGSMGSYVGVDLMIPIITLEFAPDQATRADYQMEAVRASIEYAAGWTATHGQSIDGDVATFLGELEQQLPDSGFGATVLLGDTGAPKVRADHTGDVDADPVLVLAGVRDNTPAALHIAEHLRRVGLAEAKGSPYPLSFITSAFPEGAPQGSVRVGNQGVFEDQFEMEVPDRLEAQFLVETITARPPRLVILVESTTQGRPFVRGSAPALRKIGAAPELERVTQPLSGPFAQWLTDLGVDVIQVGVDGVYAQGDSRGTRVTRYRDQAIFSQVLEF